MSPENFVFWLMGFLQENPCRTVEEGKDITRYSGMSIDQYNKILKALSQVNFK